jgi:hypothetical protein
MPAEPLVVGEVKAVCLTLFAEAESHDLEELLEDTWHMLGEAVFEEVGEDALRAFFVNLIEETETETEGKD